MADVLTGRWKHHVETDTQQQYRVTTEAETGAMQLQAMQCQGSWPAPGARKRQGRRPRVLDGVAANTLVLNFLPPELWNVKFLGFLSHQIYDNLL